MIDPIKNFKIVHWNSFKLTTERIEELRIFIKKEKPDIVCLNETKLSIENVNYLVRFDNYNVVARPRKKNPDHGGGVIILIKNTINYSDVSSLLEIDIEAMGFLLK